MIETVIFDFNGTLYFDKDLNEQSWKIIYKEIIGNEDNFNNELETILSKKDDTNIKEFFDRVGKATDKETIDKYALKKEALYQELAKSRNRNKLADGAIELLEYLNENKIKMILASASIKYNIDFYLNYCGLNKWFDYSRIAYDDGINKNKKEIYLKAIELSNTNKENILAFDDSSGSINSGIEAGIRKIIRINPHGYKKVDSPYILDELMDFKNLDYSIFKK